MESTTERPRTAQLRAEAETVLARCLKAWPGGPMVLNGRVIATNCQDVKDYLRESLAAGDDELIADAIKNARPVLGDVCGNCGEDLQSEGSGDTRYCSRECWREDGGDE